MYYNTDKSIVVKELDTNIEKGLIDNQVNKNLQKYGKNILPSKKRKSIINIFLSELLSPIEMILLITIVISFLIGETTDAIVITFIVLVDVLMGTYQENKALKSAEALSKLIKVKTKVIRNGKEKIIDAENLVIGDIVLLASGDKISADCRILESTNLHYRRKYFACR